MTTQELLVLFGVYVDDASHDRFDSPTVLALLNEGQHFVADILRDADEGYFRAQTDFSVTEAATGEYEATLPTDFISVLKAERLTTGRPVRATWINFQDSHLPQSVGVELPWETDSTVPRCYLIGDQIGVAQPGADYTLRLHYAKRLPVLDEVTDSSEVPDEHQNLIALHAASLAVPSEGSWREYEPRYQEAKSRLQTFADNRQRQEPRRVGMVDDGGGYY